MKKYTFGDPAASNILVQMVDDHDLSVIESEVSLIREFAGPDFFLIALKVDDWNRDLSPWEEPPVFGKEGFGGKAEKTLQDLKESVLSRYGQADRKFIGGYSLAGLFALWAAYREDSFEGVAAASPSVWFPGFVDMAERERILTKKVYLSLGDKEEKAKNPVMATVGDSIRRLHQIYEESNGIETVLEWNEGNHFREPELRIAKGFAWVMNRESIG